DATIVDMAACDAQHLGPSLPLLPGVAALPAANENANLDAGPSSGDPGRAQDGAGELNGDESSASRQSSDHAHVGVQSRRENEAASVARDATPPDRAAGVDAQPRAKQSVPPALRRAVL